MICYISLSVRFLQVAEGEARVSLLQREVERLTQTLLRAQEGDATLREKAVSLSQTLQEVTASHSGTQSRLLSLQKALSSSEQDKRRLQVCESLHAYRSSHFMVEF